MKKTLLIIASYVLVPSATFAQVNPGVLPPAAVQGAAAAVQGAAGAGASEPARLDNPLNADSFEGLFRNILTDIIIPVTALIGVVFIIWAGFGFVTAQGKPEEVTKAKKRLQYVLIGVAIIIASEVILDLLLNTLTQIADVNPTNN